MIYKILVFAFVLFTFCSCSSDDANTAESYADYFPLATDNSWNYNNIITENQQQVEGSENLYISNTTEAEGLTYYEFTSEAENVQGLITGILSTGSLTKTETQLIYNGNYMVDLNYLNLESISIPLTNFIVYDQDASSGEEIFSVQNTISQEVEFQGTPVTITINYELESLQSNFYEDFTTSLTENNFSNVLSSQIVLQLSANANLGPFSVDVLNEQEVLNSTNYYAENIGLIYSYNSVNYEYEDLSEFGIPTIPNVQVTTIQELDSYIITE